MRERPVVLLPWLGLVLAACTSEPSEPPPRVDEPSGCAPGELELDDGSCSPAGVGACGMGFVDDAVGGCVAVLPTDVCPSGTMAVPGDSACHEVGACGAGTWGDIPVEANSQFVDASYAGGGSDGSQAKPWTTLAEAIAAAEPTAIVAIAAGSYAGDLVLQGKSTRLWGRCPSMVEIVGSANQVAAIIMPSGGELHGVAVRGPGLGVFVPRGQVGIIESVWIHDTGGRGMEIDEVVGTTVSLRDVLVERAHEIGIHLSELDVSLERVAVRDTRLAVGSGRALNIEDHLATTQRTMVTVKQALLEGSIETGISVVGSTADVESVVVRDVATAPGAADSGVGISVEDDGALRSNLALRASIVERADGSGVFIFGSDGRIEDTVVRDLLPRQLQLPGGARGIAIQSDHLTGQPASGVLHRVVVERSREAALIVAGATAEVVSSIFRDTDAPDDPSLLGVGVAAQSNYISGEPGLLSLIGSVVERHHSAGVLATGATVSIVATRVSTISPQASQSLFGDGVVGLIELGPTSVDVTDTLLEGNQRAGLALFGARAHLEHTTIDCNGIDLVGDAFNGTGAVFEDGGGNHCGCQSDKVTCQASAAGLEAPSPLP